MYRLIIPFLILLACSCSKSTGIDPDDPLRPGIEQPETLPDVFFAPGNTTDIVVENDDEGYLHIILYREIDFDHPAGEQTCGLRLTEGSHFAAIDPYASFGAGVETAVATMRYRSRAMKSDNERIVVSIDGTSSRLSINVVRRTAQWTDSGTGVMYDGVNYLPTHIYKMSKDGKTHMRVVFGDKDERRFHVDTDGNVVLEASPGIVEAAVYGNDMVHPSVSAPSGIGDGFIALNVCRVQADGTLQAPHTEYFFEKNDRILAIATICDGWLLPVVAIDARLLDPDKNLWTAPALIHPDNSITIVGPYHNTSPLQPVNTASAASCWTINIHSGKATLTPQPAGWQNEYVFDHVFMIAGQGSATSADGALTIHFPTSLHNHCPDGSASASVDRVWGNARSTTIQVSSISDM